MHPLNFFIKIKKIPHYSKEQYMKSKTLYNVRLIHVNILAIEYYTV